MVSKLMRSISKTTYLIAVLLLISLVGPLETSALSGGDFNAGRIIDDQLFYDGNALSSSDVQTFLNSKVTVCDNNGSQTIYDSQYGDTVTRAVYSQRRGISTPFACLKDVTHDSYEKAADAYCSSLSGGRKSSAQIIYEVGKACNISQKALIVLLQKEQGLVTDDWPWPNQYRSATGYGCPDTAACDSAYYGFFNQVYNAARQFQRYAKLPSNYNYIAGRSQYIQYNPNSSCGGSNVYIVNQATAGLYNYTPYQPNQASLDNLYGSAPSCGAYGNRNFWRYYNDWFGSTDGHITLAHPDGTLVRPANSPNVYVITGGKAQAIRSSAVFTSWGYHWDRIKIATPGDLALMAASDADISHSSNPGPRSFREGSLVKGSGPAIYVIKNVDGVNTKRAFANWDAFVRMGYSIKDVILVQDSEIPLQNGDPITVDESAHPDGSLVKDAGSQTVYFLINGERHPIGSAPIFVSMGFKWDQIKTSLDGDKALPLSWAVTWYSEGTLLRGSTSSTVYIVDIDQTGINQSKRSFDYHTFVGYDYRFDEVMVVPNNELPSTNGTPAGQ